MDIKLEDVAKRVGMSKATVSLALNGNAKVNATTRQRILQAAKEMGYSPNPHARKLVTNKSNMICLVVPDIENVYYASLVDCISREMRNSGYGLFIAISENSRTREKQIIREMIENRMDGVLLVPLNKPNKDIDYLYTLDSAGIPMVYVTSLYPAVERPYVMCNLYGGMRDIVRHLYQKGRRRIAMMSGPSEVYCMDRREAGYRDEIQTLGFGYQNIIKLEDVTYTSARAYISAMGSLDIDAIACVNDMMAMGVINELSSRGISIPGDIAVAGYDDLIFSKISPVPITTVKQDLTQVADIAARMIVDLIKAQEIEKEVVIDCRVIQRESTAQL